MAEDIVRVIKIVVYEGERSWVEKTLLSSITGTKEIPNTNGCRIHAATLGSFPEVLVRKNEIRYACGEQKNDHEFGMWAGPYPTKEDALARNGESDKSVIIKFDENGTDDIIYRWSIIANKWILTETKKQ